VNRILLILTLQFFITSSILSQKIEDSELWSGYTAKYKINKKWRLSGEYQIRFDNNVSKLKNNFLELNVQKKLSKKFYLNMQYRYSWIVNERNKKRYSIDGIYKQKIFKKALKLKYRTKFQIEQVQYNGQVIVDWRNKLTIEKKLSKKIDVFGEYELFLNVFKLKSFARFDPPELTTNRYTAGFNYQIKKVELQLFYRIESSINSADNECDQIFGFGIVHKLK